MQLGQDAYQDWSDQYYNQRPRRPELRPGASFTETVVHEQRLKQYETSLERWQTAHVAATGSTAERLYNVLLFPDGGWMADRPAAPLGPPAPPVDAEREPQRQRELAELRRLYVPQTVCVLHTVLAESGRLQEAARLADLVAGEDYQLYNVSGNGPRRTGSIIHFLKRNINRLSGYASCFRPYDVTELPAVVSDLELSVPSVRCRSSVSRSCRTCWPSCERPRCGCSIRTWTRSATRSSSGVRFWPLSL